MQIRRPFARLRSAWSRQLLSAHVLNGMTAAAGLLIVFTAVHFVLGAHAAAAAATGVIVVTPPDAPSPRTGKFTQFLPAVLLGTAFFFGVQVSRDERAALFAVLAGAMFLAFLAPAWGRRALPVTASLLSATLLPLAGHGPTFLRDALRDTLAFSLGAWLYIGWATAANALLNARYRTLAVASTLDGVATLMRLYGFQFNPPRNGQQRQALSADIIDLQGRLADQVQAARNLVLERPTTAPQVQRAAMLVHLLEICDYLMACSLDLDSVRGARGEQALLDALSGEVRDLAGELEGLADALRTGRSPNRFASSRPPLALTAAAAVAPLGDQVAVPPPAALANALARRVGHVHDEVRKLMRVATGERAPQLGAVAAGWQLFVAPTAWACRPVLPLWRWDSPTLRHALRATSAVLVGHALVLVLPWTAHEAWVLLSIAFVVRGNLAQTLSRRDGRIAGTLLGCIVAAGLLHAKLTLPMLLLVLVLSYGASHAFVLHDYSVASFAGTLLALLQSPVSGAAGAPAFDLVERLLDTVVGVGIAWAFSYVFPAWESGQLGPLVRRTLAAQARHARIALGLWRAGGAESVEWRLARREAFDSLSALVQAIQRSLAEPPAVRLPVPKLQRMVVRSYHLLAQLTAIRAIVFRRQHLIDVDRLDPAMQEAARTICTALVLAASDPPAPVPPRAGRARPRLRQESKPLTPWLLRRLRLAADAARDLHADSVRVLVARRG